MRLSRGIFLGFCLLGTTHGRAEDALHNLLVDIHNTFADIRHSGIDGEHRYQFTWDTDFPCSVSILDENDFEGDNWRRRYRFELSDLETGHLLLAKDRRRAITYYGEKTSHGVVNKFPPKKVSDIRLNAPGASNLHTLFRRAIQICEERNTFQ